MFAGHPLDLIKVRLQTQPDKYKGIMDVVTKTVKADGPFGLYRGMSAPLAGVTPIFAVNFWAYGLGKRIIAGQRGHGDPDKLSLTDIGLAGAFSALPTTAIMAPGERIKCILQTQTPVNGKAPGALDVVKSLWKEGGIRSVFRGSAATLLRDGFGSFAYFGAYEGIKRSLSSADGKGPSTPAVLTAGGVAGMLNWVVAIPFDTVKSRMQAAVGDSPAARRGLLATTRHVVETEGAAALYRGVGPALLRAFPANAACFWGYETAMSVMDKFF